MNWRLLAFALTFAETNSGAALTQMDIAAAISCNSDIKKDFYLAELQRSSSKPTIKDGAYWFDFSGSLYGASIIKVFASHGKDHRFFGVVLAGQPQPILAAMENSRIYPVKTIPTNGYWEGIDGRKIMYHEKVNTKIFCEYKKL